MAVRTGVNFLAEYAALPDDLEVLPGVTVRAGREMLRRPVDDPAGTIFIPSVTYSGAAGDVGQMAIYARRDRIVLCCPRRAPAGRSGYGDRVAGVRDHWRLCASGDSRCLGIARRDRIDPSKDTTQ